MLFCPILSKRLDGTLKRVSSYLSQNKVMVYELYFTSFFAVEYWSTREQAEMRGEMLIGESEGEYYDIEAHEVLG